MNFQVGFLMDLLFSVFPSMMLLGSYDSGVCLSSNVKEIDGWFRKFIVQTEIVDESENELTCLLKSSFSM